MSYWMGFLFLTLSFFSNEVLVLKNGKSMTCDSYEVQGDKVTINAKGQTFSIPEKLIDWEASKKATEQNAQKKEAQQAKQNPKKPAAKPKKRGPISLTTKDLRKNKADNRSGPVTIQFKMLSNSIIVGMHINGKGPFNFILDTGASVTMIDPEVLAKSGVKLKQETTGVVGVGGQPIQANLCTLDELSLEGAKVYGMDAVAHRIGHLYQADLYGLIGQDFLNHFIMNLDANSKTLTLTPANAITSEVSRAESGKKYDAAEMERLLNQAFQTMNKAYRRIGQNRNGNDTNRTIRDLKLADRQIRDAKQQLRYQKSLIQTVNDSQISAEERDGFRRYQACIPKADFFIDLLQKLNRTLTIASNNENPDSTLLADLRRQVDQTNNAYHEFDACISPITP